LLSLTHTLLAGSQQVECKIRSEGWAETPERRGGRAVFILYASKNGAGKTPEIRGI